MTLGTADGNRKRLDSEMRTLSPFSKSPFRLKFTEISQWRNMLRCICETRKREQPSVTWPRLWNRKEPKVGEPLFPSASPWRRTNENETLQRPRNRPHFFFFFFFSYFILHVNTMCAQGSTTVYVCVRDLELGFPADAGCVHNGKIRRWGWQ